MTNKYVCIKNSIYGTKIGDLVTLTSYEEYVFVYRNDVVVDLIEKNNIKNCYITLSEWRNIQINKIFKDDSSV